MQLQNLVDWFVLTNSAEVKTNPVADSLNEVKLMNLLYMAQGYSLATVDRPLFREDMMAWVFGVKIVSVQKMITDRRKAFDPFRSFSQREQDSLAIVDEDDAGWEAVDATYRTFWKWSTSELTELVKKQTPWLEANRSDDRVIDQQVQKEYFAQHVLTHE